MTVVIECKENGPNIVKKDGKIVCALCRCGHSNNKPFCDGTHLKENFMAKASKIEIEK